MIKDQLHIYETKEELNKGFTEFVKEIIEENAKISISLSGGSTPKSLFDYWAEKKDSLDWTKTCFFWGDERCVAPNDEMSNYGMTKKHLFDHVAVPKENIHRIKGENPSGEEVVRYGELLAEHLPLENNIPIVDIMILGLGDDGHTVSIFPYEIEKWDAPANCVVAKHPETGMERVSLTGRVVNNARHVVFLVTGKNKAEKIRDIIENRDAFFDKYTAARVSPISKTIHWFMDEEATNLLE